MTFAIMFAAAVAAATPAAPERMPCAGAAYRQLDFWIGDWNVFQASDNTKVGTSRIESVMGGCGIAEHFEASDAPGGAYSGTSYSGYDREDGKRRHHPHDLPAPQGWIGRADRLGLDEFRPGVEDPIRLHLPEEVSGRDQARRWNWILTGLQLQVGAM